jgi:hypothetical protein
MAELKRARRSSEAPSNAVAIIVTCVALVFVAKHEFAIFYVCIGLEMQDLLNRAAPRAKPSRVDR